MTRPDDGRYRAERLRPAIRVEWEVTSWLGDQELGTVPVLSGDLSDSESDKVRGQLKLTAPLMPELLAADGLLGSHGQTLTVRRAVNGSWIDLGRFLLLYAQPDGDVIDVVAQGMLALVDLARFTQDVVFTGTFAGAIRVLCKNVIPVQFVPGVGDRLLPEQVTWERGGSRLDALWDLLQSWPASVTMRDDVLEIGPVPDDEAPGLPAETYVGGTGTVERVVETNLVPNPIPDTTDTYITAAVSLSLLDEGIRATITNANAVNVGQRVGLGSADFIPAEPGKPYSFGIEGRTDTGQPLVAYLRFYNASKQLIVDHLEGTPQQAADWTLLTVENQIAPAGTAFVDPLIGISGVGPREVGQTFDMRHWIVTDTREAFTYFDGDSAGARWVGERNNSVSEKLEPIPSTLVEFAPQADSKSANNAEIVATAPGDGSPGVAQGAYITSGPTAWGSPYGRRPGFFASPLLADGDQAAVARARLRKGQRRTGTYRISVITDDRRQVGDVIRLVDLRLDTDITARVVEVRHGITTGDDPTEMTISVLSGTLYGEPVVLPTVTIGFAPDPSGTTSGTEEYRAGYFGSWDALTGHYHGTVIQQGENSDGNPIKSLAVYSGGEVPGTVVSARLRLQLLNSHDLDTLPATRIVLWSRNDPGDMPGRPKQELGTIVGPALPEDGSAVEVAIPTAWVPKLLDADQLDRAGVGLYDPDAGTGWFGIRPPLLVVDWEA